MINKVVLLGNLTKDPEIRYGQQPNPDGSQNIIARYTLAVNRSRRKDTEEQTDFISCVSFGRSAEFAQKYLKKGTRICVTGRLQTGSYVRQDGVRVYTTDVVIENQEFAGRRPDDSTAQTQACSSASVCGSSAVCRSATERSSGNTSSGSNSNNRPGWFHDPS